MPQIIVYGRDVAKNPTISSNSSAGYHGQGQISVGAQRVFQDDDVVVLKIKNVDANGEISPSSNSGLKESGSAKDIYKQAKSMLRPL